MPFFGITLIENGDRSGVVDVSSVESSSFRFCLCLNFTEQVCCKHICGPLVVYSWTLDACCSVYMHFSFISLPWPLLAGYCIVFGLLCLLACHRCGNMISYSHALTRICVTMGIIPKMASLDK